MNEVDEAVRLKLAYPELSKKDALSLGKLLIEIKQRNAKITVKEPPVNGIHNEDS